MVKTRANPTVQSTAIVTTGASSTKSITAEQAVLIRYEKLRTKTKSKIMLKGCFFGLRDHNSNDVYHNNK